MFVVREPAGATQSSLPRHAVETCAHHATETGEDRLIRQHRANRPTEQREEGIERMDVQVALDTMWVLVAGMLVFFMNLGFGLVESGFARAKNTVNIISKNFVVFAIASIAFFVVGWGLMFGDEERDRGDRKSTRLNYSH